MNSDTMVCIEKCMIKLLILVTINSSNRYGSQNPAHSFISRNKSTPVGQVLTENLGIHPITAGHCQEMETPTISLKRLSKNQL